MRDTRTVNMRECIAEAVNVLDKQVKWLIIDVQRILAELHDEGINDEHDHVDLMQCMKFTDAAQAHNRAAAQLLREAHAELQQMERRQ